jgi:hypothetical protein
VVGGKVGGHVIHSNRARERRFSTMSVDVALCLLNHIMPSDSNLYLILDGV